MLAELARYLTTPAPWPVRRLGYLKEAIGCEARFRRCRNSWQSHLDACQDLIREAAARCPSHKRAVVLGSGGLHDVPLADLARSFQEVLLVDVIHLPVVRRRLRRFRNVRPVDRDLTGIVGALDDLTAADPLPVPDADGCGDLLDADLVISPNLLFQLPIRPRTYLEGRTRRPAAEVEVFCRAIVEAHLEALASCGGTVCLISEVEHLLVDADGAVVERDLPLAGVSLPDGGREWDWDIAPCPEAHPKYSLRHRVRGSIRPPPKPELRQGARRR